MAWGEDSHQKGAEPDYDRLFALDQVHRIDITIHPDNYLAMVAEMTEILGEFGAGSETQDQSGNGGPPTGGGPPILTAIIQV